MVIFKPDEAMGGLTNLKMEDGPKLLQAKSSDVDMLSRDIIAARYASVVRVVG